MKNRTKVPKCTQISQIQTPHQILDDLGAIIDINRQSTPHDELVDRLQQYDGPRTVAILDEVDHPKIPATSTSFRVSVTQIAEQSPLSICCVSSHHDL